MGGSDKPRFTYRPSSRPADAGSGSGGLGALEERSWILVIRWQWETQDNTGAHMKFSEIELAFEFVSAAGQYEHFAYVSKSTGATYWQSDAAGLDDLPEDLNASDDYVEIPHKNDLDLGKDLIFRFVAQEIPGLHEKVQRIFSRRGAYGRYKDFLADLGLLDTWYRFEAEQTKEALLTWCRDYDIQIEE